MTRAAKFIHLRCHTAYSLAEGAIHSTELIDLAKKYKMPALAITDSGNLFGILDFTKKAIKAGIQPIIGCIIRLQIKEQLSEIILLAKNEEGYQNLLKLVSKSYLKVKNNPLPFITWEELKEYKNGLICLTGGMKGPLGKAFLADNSGEEIILSLQEIFADNLYMEISRHNETLEDEHEEKFINLAYKHNIPLVATNDILFASRDKYEAHDILRCIAAGVKQDDHNRSILTKEYYFKSAEEMIELFKDLPEAIANSINIAKRCIVTAKESPPMLPRYDSSSDKDEAIILEEQAKAGLERRLAKLENIDETSYRNRLAMEIEIITKMGFAGYFLIVSDFIKWSKANNIPVGPGRGSGAGSIVAWSLEITELDPIRFGLLFERFLNPERISMPDFDIDFCQDRREEVINYVQQKYGYDHVAQIITIGKLQARAVLKDVGRALGMPYYETDMISKLVPHNPANPVNLTQAIEIEPELRQKTKDPRYAKLINIALQLEGLYRHASTHAAGIVIADRPVENIVALYNDDKSTMPVIQYSMKDAEAAGLVKFDFLGLRTLTIIQETINLIKRKEPNFVMDNLHFNDAKTYELLSSGKVVGVFQFESKGMRDAIRRLKPNCIEDIIALGALYRPGPMANIPDFIACKHGLQEPDYMHPLLEPILKETYGIIVYQEQVMEIAQLLANYSLGEADLLRRAMGKKIKEEMDAQKKIFIDGAVQNNIPQGQAEAIFDKVARFASYGFNKSHAAAYGIISYQTAYLKANYPLEFYNAALNYEMHNTDTILLFLYDAKKMGITILPPDINKSMARFTIEGEAIRYGLGALKNVGISIVEEITANRRDFTSIYDFIERCYDKINRRMLESFIKSGACDSLGHNRQELIASLDILVDYAQILQHENKSKLVSLFDQTASKNNRPQLLHKAEGDLLHYEKEAFSFYFFSHPIDRYQNYLHKFNFQTSAILDDLSPGVWNYEFVVNIVDHVFRVTSKNKFMFLTVADKHGIFEVSLYNNDLLEERNQFKDPNKLFYLKAEIQASEDGGVRITAKNIENFCHYMINYSNKLRFTINNLEDIEKIKTNLKSHGDKQVELIVEGKKYKIHLQLPHRYQSMIDDLSEIKALNLELL